MTDPLAHEPFSYRTTKEGLVHLLHSGRIVETLRGTAAARFLKKIVSADAKSAQLIMAKATGQFKFGNERMGKERGKGQ